MNPFLGDLALGDVGAYGNVLPRSATRTEKRDDGGIDPVQRSVFGPVLDFAVPDRAARNRAIHLLEKILGVVPRVKDAVILADQFVLGVLTDGAEFLIDVGNRALHVGHRHDGVLIESELLVGQFFDGILAHGEACFHSVFRPLPFRDISANGYVLLRFALRV